MRIGSSVALAACLTAILAGQVWAGELAGVTLPGQMKVGESTLLLNGMGLREATWLRINVYVAGLYLETRSSDAKEILRDNRPKRITLVFVRSVGRKNIIKEWDKSLMANLAQDFEALEGRLATFHAWLPDKLSEGDEVTLTWLAGEGLVVEIKGEVKGTIPGTDFARAVLAVWLGPRPPNRSLKIGLLDRG